MHNHVIIIMCNDTLTNALFAFTPLQWLENDFLQYLEKCRMSVDLRPGFSKGEKAIMCSSHETLEGLHITGKLLHFALSLNHYLCGCMFSIIHH